MIYDDTWRALMNAQVDKTFTKALYESEEHIMRSYVIENEQQAIEQAKTNVKLYSDGVSRYIDGIYVGYDENGVFQTRNYMCQAEMVRDYAKEAQLNDGYTYWRTTGRTVVTWASGEITYLIRKEVYTYSFTVTDCGYDESLPF